MTFAAVAGGQFGTESINNVSFTSHAVGNFVLASAGDDGSNTTFCTALSSSNATWTLLGTSFAGTNDNQTAQLFLGQVTAVSTATVTATFSGGTGNPYIVGREFSTTAGFSAVTFDKQGHIDVAGTANLNWASLTPANNGSLYWGRASDASSAVSGTTSGYVYTPNADSHGNGEAYNLSCPAGVATFPVWGATDGGQQFGLMVLVYEAGTSNTASVTQINPGPTWLDYFKPGMPRPRTPAPQIAQQPPQPPDIPSINPGPFWYQLFKHWQPKPYRAPLPSWPSISATGSFSLAPLNFAASGSQTSPDIPKFEPGPLWLQLFKPGIPKPNPRMTPPGAPSVSCSGSFTLAPLAFAANGSQTSPDVPSIFPGPAWFDLFKPQWQKPHPYLLDQGQLPAGGVTSTGSFSLAPLAFLAQGNQTSPDVPQVSPGTTWLRLFRPDLYKPVPVPPAFQSVNAAGSFSLAPFAFAAQGNQTSPDIPQVQPGPVWIRLFRPDLYKPVPPVAATPSVNTTGSFTLAPLAFSAMGNQTSADVPQVNPGATWLALFKRELKPLPWISALPPAGVSGSGSFTLAPLMFQAQGNQTSPDQPRIFPGPVWLDLFKPGLLKSRPVPPAIQGVSSTGSFALAPLAFAAAGTIALPGAHDQPQINPGPRWLAQFKHRQRPVLILPGGCEFGPFNIYLPGGCIRFGTFKIAIPLPAVSIQALRGEYGPISVRLPSPAVTLAGKHSPLWPGFIIPPLKVSLTAKVQGGTFNITLPGPKVALTGPTTHVHSGPFNLGLTCTGGMGGHFLRRRAVQLPPVQPADWTLGQPQVSWKITQPVWKAWTVGFSSVSISHLSTQYVLVPVQASKNGAAYNPGADPVQFAFMPTPTQVPITGDWVSGSWQTVATNVLYPYSARCLVGAGGAITLGIGTYIMYLKISDSPETPVLIAGQLEVQ